MPIPPCNWIVSPATTENASEQTDLATAAARSSAVGSSSAAKAAPSAAERAALAEEFGADHVAALPCDVTDQQQVDALFALAAERHGGLDVVVNNAGLGVRPTSST